MTGHHLQLIFVLDSRPPRPQSAANTVGEKGRDSGEPAAPIACDLGASKPVALPFSGKWIDRPQNAMECIHPLSANLTPRCPG